MAKIISGEIIPHSFIEIERTISNEFRITAHDSYLGEEGRASITLRISPQKNPNQHPVYYAKDFLEY